MPFDGLGNYTLPQAAFITNTTISSAAVNSDFSDIAAALTTAQKGIIGLQSAGSTTTGFQNRADAIASSIGASITYLVLYGYTTPGDCDGIPLVFKRGTSPTQGSFLSADGQRWILQNKNPHVGMFGAVGDGTTDDSLSISNAVTYVKTNNVSGGTIWFSNKVYATLSTIIIGDGSAGVASSYNGITLAGLAGVSASAIEFTGDTQGATLKWLGAANGTLLKFAGPINSCGLSNFCLNGNVTTAKALYLSHSYRGRFDNVLIKKYSQNNATDTGLYFDSVALPGTVTVAGNENLFINLQVEDAGNSVGRAVAIIGSSYNQFNRGLISIPGTGTGILIQATATNGAAFNTFVNLRVAQQNTGTGTPVTFDNTAGTVKDNVFLNCDVPGGWTNTNTSDNNPTNTFSRISPQGRLTLTTATPVMTATASAQTTVFYTPYIGNQVPIWNGATFVPTTFAEVSQATSDNTKSPAAVGASGNYDVFVWNDGGTIRATRGPVWTSDTARGSGAGTTELQRINGILTNKVAITNGPGINRGTYVGTIRSNAGSTIDWTLGAAASGGTPAVLNVWNCYNRIRVATAVTDNGAQYTYTTATIRQARASTGNQVTFLAGLAEDAYSAIYNATMETTAGTTAQANVFIGLDSTTANIVGTTQYLANNTGAAVTDGTVAATTQAQATLGTHFLAMLEKGDGTHANNFNHDTQNTLTFVFQM